jgi:hypothetical protein
VTRVEVHRLEELGRLGRWRTDLSRDAGIAGSTLCHWQQRCGGLLKATSKHGPPTEQFVDGHPAQEIAALSRGAETGASTAWFAGRSNHVALRHTA